MKLTIPRKEIKAAIAGLSRVLPKRKFLPILQSVRIAVENGKATATTTDLDQQLTYRFKDFDAQGDGVVLVPFETLKLLNGGLNSEPVTIEAADGNDVIITNTVAGQSVPRRFATIAPDEWPSPMTAADVGPVDPAFLTNFRRASLFASADPCRMILNGIFLNVTDSGDYIVATDGRRLGAFNTIKFPLSSSCVVPASKFMTWTKLAGDELLIGHKGDADGGWFRLVTALWDYRCRTQPGTYPNWKQVVPADGGAHIVELSESDAELLRTVLPKTFPGHDAHCAPVKIEAHADNRVSIAGRGGDDKSPSRLDLVNSRGVGPAGFITVDRFKLLDALAAGFRRFAFEDEKSPLHSRDEAGGVHVLMPVNGAHSED